MSLINLLYKDHYVVTDSKGDPTKIKVVLPTVGQVIDHEEEYFRQVHTLTAMPIDVMVYLDKAGIDFTSINEYELFLMMFGELQKQDTSLIFKDLDLSKFERYIDTTNNSIVLVDVENDIKIDRAIHRHISEILRKIHHIEKDRRKPANEEAKEYMLERARAKAKRNQRRATVSQLEPLIIAMVNTEQYKYDFEGTRELSIYQFNECVQQVASKIAYDNRMHGVYAGTIDPKGLKEEDFSWIRNFK